MSGKITLFVVREGCVGAGRITDQQDDDCNQSYSGWPMGILTDAAKYLLHGDDDGGHGAYKRAEARHAIDYVCGSEGMADYNALLADWTINLPDDDLELMCAADECQEIWVDWEDRKIGFEQKMRSDTAVPMRQWHGHIEAWRLPDNVTADDLLTQVLEILPDLETRANGYESEWDGHNHVAVFDEDAAAASDAIDNAMQDFAENYTYPREPYGHWDACEWLTGDLPEGLTADSTDEDLERIAQQMRADAGPYVILDGLDNYLRDRRQQLQDEADHD